MAKNPTNNPETGVIAKPEARSDQQASLRQRTRQDALELAYLIYEIFIEKQSNDKININNGGDDV